MSYVYSLSVGVLCAAMLMSKSGFAGEAIPAPRIINGSSTDISKYPFLVSIQEKYDGSFHHRCGGTFLSARKILTAAHCIKTEDGSLYKTEDLQVVSGMTTLYEGQGQVTQIADMKVHPNFSFPPYFDVAVITLTEAVEGFVPVSLATSGPKTKTDAIVVGWGSIDYFGGTKPVNLLDGDVRINSAAQCRRNLNRYAHPKPTPYAAVFCATSKPSNICDGDSGGPVLQRVNGNLVQIGITSATLDECGGRHGSGFVRISAKQIESFIRANQ